MGTVIDSAIAKRNKKNRRVVPVHFYNRKVWAWETMAPNLAKRFIVHTTYSGRNMKNSKAYYEKLYGKIKLRRCAFIVIK